MPMITPKIEITHMPDRASMVFIIAAAVPFGWLVAVTEAPVKLASLLKAEETDGASQATGTPGEVSGYGLAVSWLSGSGFSYRRWMPGGWGYQVSGFPYINGQDYFVNVGGQWMQTLVEVSAFRAYGLVSAGLAHGNTFTTEIGRAHV